MARRRPKMSTVLLAGAIAGGGWWLLKSGRQPADSLADLNTALAGLFDRVGGSSQIDSTAASAFPRGSDGVRVPVTVSAENVDRVSRASAFAVPTIKEIESVPEGQAVVTPEGDLYFNRVGDSGELSQLGDAEYELVPDFVKNALGG